MAELLGDTQEKHRMVNKGSNGLTAIYGPDGKHLAGPLDPNEEGMVLAEIDIEEIIEQKLQHDIAGHYNRFDVLSLNLNRRPQKAIHEMHAGEDREFVEKKELEELKNLIRDLAEKVRAISSE
jgi:aliphatic nitrilase